MPGSTTASTTGDGMDHGGMGKEGEMSTGATGMAMPGMMSDAQMQDLTDATGADFDRLFVELMIVHHQGALEWPAPKSRRAATRQPLPWPSRSRPVSAEFAEIQQLCDPARHRSPSDRSPPPDTRLRLTKRRPRRHPLHDRKVFSCQHSAHQRS